MEFLTPFKKLDELTISKYIVRNKKLQVNESFNNYDDAKKFYKKTIKNTPHFKEDTDLDCVCEEYGLITIHYTFNGRMKNYSFSI